MEQSQTVLSVISIFAASTRNTTWYELQRRFLAQATEVPYKYRILLNGIGTAGFEPGDVAAVNRDNLGHGEALMQALALLRQERCASYLVLDSDCFPVFPGWHGVLTRSMARFGKHFAAPVRTENLDVFPHPCAMFFLDSVIDDPRLELRAVATASNLLGMEVRDVGCATQEMKEILFPLLRTNVINLHPVAAGIYHHLFYHHGAGSRDFRFRILNKFNYYDHWFPPGVGDTDSDGLFGALVRNPDRFISRLMRLPLRSSGIRGAVLGVGEPRPGGS